MSSQEYETQSIIDSIECQFSDDLCLKFHIGWFAHLPM